MGLNPLSCAEGSLASYIRSTAHQYLLILINYPLLTRFLCIKTCSREVPCEKVLCCHPMLCTPPTPFKGRGTSLGHSERSRCHRSRFVIGKFNRSNRIRDRNSQPIRSESRSEISIDRFSPPSQILLIVLTLPRPIGLHVGVG